ncbi:uncharacterized protein A4U43_C05F34780 [Asparagus officinalis]|uniref:Syntaxin 6/10/61 N-terminal domain-containing protein n=1 Tax=Asparagus officinalis TaxID=4686 RepID=A0A5P1F1H1_ASPOF|nr:uncharacterized protein LOC109841327 [Asparagus officinalis]ONK70541.1 uncharacterized protein A4U43_C05F34780 [Asparagus officinalis]
MAVISTFDQWQKDVFFSAAEEVQESADTMESTYRMWVRERNDGIYPEFLDEMRKELHTTLGTAKWQLEDFEREVSLSHEKYPSEENTITRHREFIAAIRNKISHIEDEINDSLLQEGRQPLRWIQLDEKERDDFENFLSISPQNLHGNKGKIPSHESARGFKETVTISKDKYLVEVSAKQHLGNRDEVLVQEENLDEQRKGGSSPDWRIVIADEEDPDKKLVKSKQEMNNRASGFWGFLRSVETKAKLTLFRNSFRKVKSGEHIQTENGFSNYLDLKGISLLEQGANGLSERSRNCFGSCKESPKGSSVQQIGRVGGLQRHFQGSQYNNRSLRITLLLVLTVFFIVPFVFYST